MKLTQIMCLTASMFVAIAALSQQPASPAPQDQPTRTKVVLLGTGTPVPDPDRSGPATAIVVGDSAYLVDFGPGVVRRAESAALNRNIPAVQPRNLKVRTSRSDVRAHSVLISSNSCREVSIMWCT